MNIFESVTIAIDSIRQNKLRASLTLLSIAIGVFAIIGSSSLVNSIEKSVTQEMSALGNNTFMISRLPQIQMGNVWWKYRKRKAITYSQAKELKKQMTLTKMITAESTSGGNIIKYSEYETNPDVSLKGVDENYLSIMNESITNGRGFTREDISMNRNVAIIGNDVKVKLFPNLSPLGKEIKIKNHKFTVIGLLEAKGAILGQSQDNEVFIPLSQFLRYYANRWDESVDITAKAIDEELLMLTVDEAIGVMRSIRNQKPWQENSFEIETNEAINDQFSSLTGYLSIFGSVSGAIALIAAGVGIMNIMLVSVKERTREIGIRKAVGAKKRWILLQFIIEAITLSQVGGIIGIILGIFAGSVAGNAMGLMITVPIASIINSIVICTLIGVAFGAYPAWKAARLDPIDALRYE